MKIAIVVGHNKAAQGAVRVTDKRSEYDWNGQLAEMIRSHNTAAVKVFHRTPGGGYSAEIDRVYKQVDAWGADCSLELHFNASGSSSVSGGETLSSGTSGSMRLAKLVRPAVAAALGNKDRGVKVLSRTDRGGRSLWQGRAPAVLVEPYFGSNVSDCNAADKHMDELAEAYYRAAAAFLGHTAATPPSVQAKPLTPPTSAPLVADTPSDDERGRRSQTYRAGGRYAPAGGSARPPQLTNPKGNTMTKSIFTSWTFWFNAASFVVALATALADAFPDYREALLMVVTIGNVILRFKTSQPVSLKPPRTN
ncbi:hypothetical protein AN189_17710 [Loktanella sp. 3ANDIMAR09]|uniref:N-acetylmuramoyl-L-alanine amidase n=1 Tax=Loktanella sp. 3ANDIMAR09 TaxID=1225657 RepID=UPI0006F84DBC|nr:N-acetylmuramoyl-L-alanine amidase [Loktanella sp. 3ANDIMAR09]KQI67059.1 hypothetical protein AN189_17710 [Loktanella sp. 3ANDIMAR09]